MGGSYEDYDATSANYDANRRPLGLGVIVGILAGGGMALGGARILDAGCGTGSYLAALAGQVGRLDGLELSAGMLEKATGKLARHTNVKLVQGSVLEVPFDAGTFDAVLVNQVLHHLDEGRDSAFPNVRRALAECHRVLKGGGAIVLNTCSQEQVFEGAWYTSLVPAAVERMARRYPPIARLHAMLGELGFEVGEDVVPLGERFATERYLEAAGPLEKRWRDGDSLWALASEAELDAALAELRGMIARGEADGFVKARDDAQQRIGQATFVHGWKRVAG